MHIVRENKAGVSAAVTDLMCPADEIQVMFVQELGDDLCPKRERDAPIILSPSHRLLIRVRPEQIAQQALIGNVCWAHDTTNLLH